MNSTPLWLPEGSVRSLLALLVVGTVFGRMAFGLDVGDVFVALAGAVLAGYGLMREMQRRDGS